MTSSNNHAPAPTAARVPSAPGESTEQITAAAADRAAAAAERRRAESANKRAAQLLALARSDELTGALNRQHGRQQIQSCMQAAQRSSTPLAVVFFDVDGLKRVNDVFGHRRGDELLTAAGSALRSVLRGDDVVVRYGGDEFVCALPGTPAEAVPSMVGRVRDELGRLIPGATVSAGHTQLTEGDKLDDIIDRADADLYRERRSRRAGDGKPVEDPASAPLLTGVALRERSIACGACAGRIDLADFVLANIAGVDVAKSDVGGTDGAGTEVAGAHRHRMVRTADCPTCGETSVIALLRPGG